MGDFPHFYQINFMQEYFLIFWAFIINNKEIFSVLCKQNSIFAGIFNWNKNYLHI